MKGHHSCPAVLYMTHQGSCWLQAGGTAKRGVQLPSSIGSSAVTADQCRRADVCCMRRGCAAGEGQRRAAHRRLVSMPALRSAARRSLSAASFMRLASRSCIRRSRASSLLRRSSILRRSRSSRSASLRCSRLSLSISCRARQGQYSSSSISVWRKRRWVPQLQTVSAVIAPTTAEEGNGTRDWDQVQGHDNSWAKPCSVQCLVACWKRKHDQGWGVWALHRERPPTLSRSLIRRSSWRLNSRAMRSSCASRCSAP